MLTLSFTYSFSFVLNTRGNIIINQFFPRFFPCTLVEVLGLGLHKFFNKGSTKT